MSSNSLTSMVVAARPDSVEMSLDGLAAHADAGDGSEEFRGRSDSIAERMQMPTEVDSMEKLGEDTPDASPAGRPSSGSMEQRPAEPTGEAYDFTHTAPQPRLPSAAGFELLPPTRERKPPRHVPAWERLYKGSLRPTAVVDKHSEDAVRPPPIISRRVYSASTVPGMPAQPFGAPRVRRLVQPKPLAPDVIPMPPPGILDGFAMLAASGVDEPERATVANLPGQNLVGVESGDMTYFTALAALDVSDNLLGSMGALAGLGSLRELKLSCNNLPSLGLPPGFFTSLRVLDCAYNRLGPDDLVPLSALPSLVWLDMTSNRVDVIIPEICGGFRVLEVLSLGSQRPRLHSSDLEPLAQLPRVRVLHLPSNAVDSVPTLPPDAFPCLELLDLRSNAVADSEALAPLARCAQLREVLLHGNPMAERPELPRAGGVLRLTAAGDAALAQPSASSKNALAKAMSNFGLEAPIPTVEQAISGADRVDHLARRLDEMIMAQRDSAGELEFGIPEESPDDLRWEADVEAEFADAVGYEARGRGGVQAAARADERERRERREREERRHGQQGAGGSSFFLTEVDDDLGGPLPEPAVAVEEPFREGQAQRRGPPVDPTAAYTALRMALDHPLSKKPLVGKDGKAPHFCKTTAAMTAHMRAVGAVQPALAPMSQWPSQPQMSRSSKQRPKKKVVVDTIQHLLGSMKNRLDTMGERVAEVEDPESDSSVD